MGIVAVTTALPEVYRGIGNKTVPVESINPAFLTERDAKEFAVWTRYDVMELWLPVNPSIFTPVMFEG